MLYVPDIASTTKMNAIDEDQQLQMVFSLQSACLLHVWFTNASIIDLKQSEENNGDH